MGSAYQMRVRRPIGDDALIEALEDAGQIRVYSTPMDGQFRVQPDGIIRIVNEHGFAFSGGWIPPEEDDQLNTWLFRGWYGDEEIIPTGHLATTLGRWLEVEPTTE